jgi:hypothetical protein
MFGVINSPDPLLSAGFDGACSSVLPQPERVRIGPMINAGGTFIEKQDHPAINLFFFNVGSQ